MPATYVTEAELRSNLGIGSLYTSATVEECCQTAQDLLDQYLWYNEAPVVGASLNNNVATLVLANPGIFVTGQTIAVENCGNRKLISYTKHYDSNDPPHRRHEQGDHQRSLYSNHYE